jgi:hypothetical protein
LETELDCVTHFITTAGWKPGSWVLAGIIEYVRLETGLGCVTHFITTAGWKPAELIQSLPFQRQAPYFVLLYDQDSKSLIIVIDNEFPPLRLRRIVGMTFFRT